MKKLLLLGAIAAVGYVVYRQVTANQAEEDLWNEATNAPSVEETRNDAAEAFGGDVDDPRKDAAEAFGGNIEN